MRFILDRIEEDDVVVGRNDQVDIPLGTVFTRITKCRVDGDLMSLNTVELGTVESVELELIGIHWYKSIDLVPAGHSAGLVLKGQGTDTLRKALGELAERELLSLET